MRVFPLETWGLFGQQWTAGEWTIAIKHKGSKKEGPNWYFVDSCFFMFFSGFKKEWEFNRTFEQVWPYLKRIVWVRKWLQDELSLVVWVFFFWVYAGLVTLHYQNFWFFEYMQVLCTLVKFMHVLLLMQCWRGISHKTCRGYAILKRTKLKLKTEFVFDVLSILSYQRTKRSKHNQ